ncbi:hypothetical protein [Nonomuraea sediminis]|uniref:hypothetical protein n=1 Tax=Nonomuraea sediminis TaxID=2835864 RepID=UPI001BDD15C6|nr:hypothetical protein [Nonomuraea sediminis]
MKRRMAGLAAGMVAVLVLGGSGALAASPQPGPTGKPCAETAPCSPDDLAKLKEEAARTADPGKDGVRCSADVKQPESPDPGKLAQVLADTLGVGLDRAKAAADDLSRLAKQGGISPDSPEFAAVAARLGVSAERLHEALVAFKRGIATQEDKLSPSKTPGS